MAKTYADLRKEIAALEAEAERMKHDEVEGVIARIKEAIAAYDLKPYELGFGAKPGRKPGRPYDNKPGNKPGPKPGPRGSKSSKSKFGAKAKFRDANGNIWVGRGPRPQWLREALASGKSLQDFAV
jgi:DNA-binding protein H-NS